VILFGQKGHLLKNASQTSSRALLKGSPARQASSIPSDAPKDNRCSQVGNMPMPHLRARTRLCTRQVAPFLWARGLPSSCQVKQRSALCIAVCWH